MGGKMDILQYIDWVKTMKTSEKQLIFPPDRWWKISLYMDKKPESFVIWPEKKHKQCKYFCERCLHGFKREDLLERHTPDCRGINQAAAAIEMTEPREKIMFNNYCKQLKAPYITYADFEAIIHKLRSRETWNSKHGASWGVWIQLHCREMWWRDKATRHLPRPKRRKSLSNNITEGRRRDSLRVGKSKGNNHDWWW